MTVTYRKNGKLHKLEGDTEYRWTGSYWDKVKTFPTRREAIVACLVGKALA